MTRRGFVSGAAQINDSPRLAHERQHEHVVRFPVCLRAQRPQTCKGGRGGGGERYVDVTAGSVFKWHQRAGQRRPSNVSTLEAVGALDRFPESHRLSK